jgi:alkylated DNA repair dioxygenase AlkB
MTEQELLWQEKRNTGTAWTRNDLFEELGYLVVKNLWDPQELYRPVPEIRGQINYWGTKPDQYHLTEVESQVNGSLATYTHPQYKEIHCGVRKKLESVIGRELYNTYYYDRFYFAGQELTRHADRDACEISVSVHISSNIDECWPFSIKTVDGDEVSVCLQPGDGLLYKGCERPHWRDPLQSRYKRKRDRLKNWITRKQDDTYYHQVFFHYVLADGLRAQCYNDAAR